jgi:hypothetical protein
MKQIMRVAVGELVLLVLAAVMPSFATPIRPDVRKILSRSEESVRFPLARAGWDGPQVSPSSSVELNPTLERIGPAASAREAQASLKASAVPDYRAVAGILLTILLLRRIRLSRGTAFAEAPSPRAVGLPRAA